MATILTVSFCSFVVLSFKEHCFNISRDISYSVFYHFLVTNLMTSKMSLSLKQKKIFRKEKRHSSVFRKAFQISGKYFLCHIHFDLHLNFMSRLK